MQAWDDFLHTQEKELGIDTVRKWLRTLKITKFDACNIYVEAQDAFQAMWFEEHIRPKVQTELLNNNKKKIRVHLSVSNPHQGAPQKRKTPPSAKIEPPSVPSLQLNFDEFDPHCTFETFVPTELNRLPWILLNDLTRNRTDAGCSSKTELGSFNPIYIHGPSGSGKTHLLMATARKLKELGYNPLYVRAETFTEHVVNAIRSGEMHLFRQTYRNIDVLLIDDIQVFSRKGATQEELFHTFNTLHIAAKQIILTANCAPASLEAIEPRLVSRFEWGIVLPLEPLNEDDIQQVLQKKAEALHYKLSPKIADFLLATFKSSPKSMLRAFKALILRFHLIQEKEKNIPTTLSVSLAKTLLTDLMEEETRRALTPDRIFKTISEHFGILREDLMGKAQSRDCVLPRQIAMHFCRSVLNLPFKRIGSLFSKDHSTVMSSVKQINAALEQKIPEIVTSIDAVKKRLDNELA